jgi:predicted DNA-binding protein
MNKRMSYSPPRMALNLDKTVIRLSAETRKRIEALEGQRGMAAFIRDAVERELTRREKAVRPKPKST